MLPAPKALIALEMTVGISSLNAQVASAALDSGSELTEPARPPNKASNKLINERLAVNDALCVREAIRPEDCHAIESLRHFFGTEKGPDANGLPLFS